MHLDFNFSVSVQIIEIGENNWTTIGQKEKFVFECILVFFCFFFASHAKVGTKDNYWNGSSDTSY